MFAEPLTVTIDGVANNLPRVTMEKFRSGWGDPSGDVSATIAHSFNGNEQSMVRVDLKKVTADPLNPGSNIPVQASAWVVVRAPSNQFGFTDAELVNLTKGLRSLITDAFLAQLLRKES